MLEKIQNLYEEQERKSPQETQELVRLRLSEIVLCTFIQAQIFLDRLFLLVLNKHFFIQNSNTTFIYIRCSTPTSDTRACMVRFGTKILTDGGWQSGHTMQKN